MFNWLRTDQTIKILLATSPLSEWMEILLSLHHTALKHYLLYFLCIIYIYIYITPIHAFWPCCSGVTILVVFDLLYTELGLFGFSTWCHSQCYFCSKLHFSSVHSHCTSMRGLSCVTYIYFCYILF